MLIITHSNIRKKLFKRSYFVVKFFSLHPSCPNVVCFTDITPWLVFTNRYYVREMTTEGESYRRITQGFENVVSLDFDIQNDLIYFTDVKEHKIYKIFINGTNQETVIQHDVPSAEGIAVDWIGRY